MADWNHENGLSWRALARFGIEIDHDLAYPLPGGAADRLIELFQDHSLILARGQALSMEQQSAFMALIGSRYDLHGGTGYVTTEAVAATGRAELTFHSDYAFTEYPQAAVSLFALDLVDDASSTLFANAGRGYDTLPAALRERLAAHRVENILPSYQDIAVRAFEMPEPDALVRHICSSVVANPRSGRLCLNVNEMQTARAIGMDWAESSALMRDVYAHLYAPENVIEHVWRRGDIVIWDNLTFQHARSSIEGVGRRVLQRVSLAPKGLWDMYPRIMAKISASATMAPAP